MKFFIELENKFNFFEKTKKNCNFIQKGINRIIKFQDFFFDTDKLFITLSWA